MKNLTATICLILAVLLGVSGCNTLKKIERFTSYSSPKTISYDYTYCTKRWREIENTDKINLVQNFLNSDCATKYKQYYYGLAVSLLDDLKKGNKVYVKKITKSPTATEEKSPSPLPPAPTAPLLQEARQHMSVSESAIFQKDSAEIENGDHATCRGIYNPRTWTNCVGTREQSSSGLKYTGEWRNGLPNGKGNYTYTNGDQYIGGIKNGKRHGKGTYIYAKGDKYVGGYKDGRRHGKGTVTIFRNGSSHSTIWEDGIDINEGRTKDAVASILKHKSSNRMIGLANQHAKERTKIGCKGKPHGKIEYFHEAKRRLQTLQKEISRAVIMLQKNLISKYKSKKLSDEFVMTYNEIVRWGIGKVSRVCFDRNVLIDTSKRFSATRLLINSFNIQRK